MTRLSLCARCGGFLGPAGGACPHCGERAGAGAVAGLITGALALVGGGAVAITLAACYGGAYFPEDYDLARDPRDLREPVDLARAAPDGGADAGDAGR